MCFETFAALIAADGSVISHSPQFANRLRSYEHCEYRQEVGTRFPMRPKDQDQAAQLRTLLAEIPLRSQRLDRSRAIDREEIAARSKRPAPTPRANSSTGVVRGT